MTFNETRSKLIELLELCKNCKYYDGNNRICRNTKARYVGCEECYNANPKPTNADRNKAVEQEGKR